jgi:hypothetical protein
MNQYIITEEQLESIKRLGEFSNGFFQFVPLLINSVRSHPYNPQAEREKVLDILICPCRPNANGFCTTPNMCIAKRMLDQEDCDMVCKAMQELRQSKDGE